jgi:uncharacterized membrane protein YfcA
MFEWLLLIGLATAGVGVGVIAGLLGVGGGGIMVPLLVAMGVPMTQAIGTSCLAIVLTAVSGSLHNLRAGVLDLRRVLSLGLPAATIAFLAADLANDLPAIWLKIGFAGLLLSNIYLMQIKNRLAGEPSSLDPPITPRTPAPETPASETSTRQWTARLITGGVGGVIAGFFGVGGGIVMVPLQVLLLKEPIKLAIQTSLGVIVLALVFATVSHARHGNVLYAYALALGAGGAIGAQLGARFLPKLSDRLVANLFRGLLVILATYMLYQAWTTPDAG